MAKFLCILFLAAICGAAQTVEGTVTNVSTGGPVAGVKVVLQQGDKAAYTATSDAEGRFRISGVKEGTYLTRYSADRYFLPGRGPTAFPQIQVGAGGIPVRVEARMIPLSRIGGRVIDPRGDPVAKARIELTTMSAFWAAQTDAKGNFEMPDVMPVNSGYALSVSPPADWKAPGPDPDSGEARAWPRTFYPSTPFRELAAPLAPRIGSDLLGLEIRLLPVPVRAIRGVLLAPDGKPVPKGTLTLWDIGPGRDAAYRTEPKADGSFEFPAVAQGDWRIRAAAESAGVNLKASEWIEIKARDIEGMKLRLSAPFTLQGRVVMETREGTALPEPPRVTMIKQHNGQILFQEMSILDATPEADGRFRFEGLYPGTYQIVPGGSPPPFYLDGVRLGDATVSGEAELSAGSAEMTILYKSSGGTVRGAVEKCGSGQVWLIPRDQRNGRNFFASCDGAGRYQLVAVRPGEYYALAVPGDELWPGNVNATFVRTATMVTVRSGETTQIDLKLSTSR